MPARCRRYGKVYMLDDLKKLICKRWQEMLLIVVFMAIWMFLFELLNAEAAAIQQAASDGPLASLSSNMSQTTTSLYFFAMMAFMVTWLTLFLGFLGTLNINYPTALDPIVLIRIGVRFFWRFIRFELILSLYFIAASIVVCSAISFLFFGSADAEIPSWVYQICGVIVMGILAKPILLIPPIMICRNCMVLQAIRKMPEFRILEMKALPIVYVTGLLIIGGITALHTDMPSDTNLFKVVVAVKAIIAGIFSLMTGVIGIWFVGGYKFGVLEEMVEEQEE
jgi:hypothetical protein